MWDLLRWWRHQMGKFSMLRALSKPMVTDGFPSQRPVSRRFDIFFDLRLNKRLTKFSGCRWFQTPSRSCVKYTYSSGTVQYHCCSRIINPILVGCWLIYVLSDCNHPQLNTYTHMQNKQMYANFVGTSYGLLSRWSYIERRLTGIQFRYQYTSVFKVI